MIGTATVLLAVALAGAATPAATAVGPGQDGAYACLACHADKRRSFTVGVHAERGIRCHDCHGGDPSAFETSAAHRGRFIGSPGKVATAHLCARCHSDPAQMRPYGLHADQLAEFRASRHGQLLFGRGDTAAPTCTDCHDAHQIFRPDDARSGVHPANIPSTCAKCHADAQLMAKYGIRADQIAQYRAGAHGIALFEKRNLAAPTCVGCHGSHAALPPAVTEIARVCDRCHTLLSRALYRGPHGAPALDGRIPGCVACHSDHGTERVLPDQIAALCQNCHAPNTRGALIAMELQERAVRATEEMRLAQDVIAELVRVGQPVAEARFRYRTAFTHYQQLAAIQHSLDLDLLEDLGLRIASVSRELRRMAEVRAERRWEHKLLLVPVWFLAIAAVVFAWFKLRELRAAGE